MASTSSPPRAQVNPASQPDAVHASDAGSPSPRRRQPTSSSSGSSSPLRRFSLLRKSKDKDSPTNKRSSLSQLETSPPSRGSSSGVGSSPRASTSTEPGSPTRQSGVAGNGRYTGEYGGEVLSESPANMSEGHLMASLVAEEEAHEHEGRRDRPGVEAHTGVPSILVSPSSPIQPPESPMRAGNKDRPRRASRYSDEDDDSHNHNHSTTANSTAADSKPHSSPASRSPSTKAEPLDKTDPQPPTSWLKRIGLDSGPSQPPSREAATSNPDSSAAGPASPSLFSLPSFSMPSMPSMTNFSIPTLSSLVPKLPPTTSFPVFEEVSEEEDEEAPPSPDAGTDGSHKPRSRRPPGRKMSGSAVLDGDSEAPSDLHLDEADENGRSFTHRAPAGRHHLRSPSEQSAAGPRKASTSSSKSHSRVNPLEHAIASAAPNSARQAELEAAERRWAAGPQGANGAGGAARPGLGRKQSITQMGKALMGSPAVTSELGPVPSSSSGGSSQPEPKPSGMVAGVEGSPRKTKFSLLSSMRRKKNGNIPRPLSLTSVPDSPAGSLPPNSPGASSIVTSPDRARARDGREKIKLAKVRVSGKKHRELDHLFIAQELNFASSLQPKASPPLPDAASAHSAAPSHSEGPKPVWVTKWSPDGKLFAAGGHGGVVRVWKVLSTAEERANQEGGGVMPVFESAPLVEWRSHEADVLDMCWSKNSNFLLTSSMDSSVRLFHVDRAECLCAFQHLALVTSIAFCPVNDKYFVSGSMDKVLRLWGVVERSVIRSTFLPEMITSVGFTQDGQQAIAGSFTGEVRFFDVASFKFNTQFLAASTRGQNAAGHKITSIVPFPLPSTGGERILISSNGKSARIRLFHVEDKLEEVKFGGHENSSSQIRADWSDDGRYVISGSESGEVVVWDSGLVPQAGGKGWLAIKKEKKGPPFEHWHVPGASVVTCASFAPSVTREVLAGSGDPVFDDGRNHLAPLERTLSGASLSVISSVATRFVGADPEEHVPNAAKDAIIVAADSETGVLRVYRNSRVGGGAAGGGLTRKQQNRMSAGSGWSGR